MIPAEAVEALAAVLAQEALVSADMDGHGWDAENDDPAPFMPHARERARTYLEAAAPHMLIHVHHHDIEKHAESFNEGYETCMAQELADDPTAAQDWLDEKLRAAKEEAWSHGHHDGAVDQMLHMENGGAKTTPNPYMLNNEGEE